MPDEVKLVLLIKEHWNILKIPDKDVSHSLAPKSKVFYCDQHEVHQDQDQGALVKHIPECHDKKNSKKKVVKK